MNFIFCVFFTFIFSVYIKHSSIIMFNNICNGSTENMRSLSPVSSQMRINGNYKASPSPTSTTTSPSLPTNNKFTSTNNKITSYYHTFNCSRDMKKRKNNFLNRDMTNNTINELKNNFERLIEETQRQAGKKQIINNLQQQQQHYNNHTNNKHHITSNGGNEINNLRIVCNRQDILMNTDRRNKKLTSYGDDLSNIDVKSLVSIFFMFRYVYVCVCVYVCM